VLLSSEDWKAVDVTDTRLSDCSFVISDRPPTHITCSLYLAAKTLQDSSAIQPVYTNRDR